MLRYMHILSKSVSAKIRVDTDGADDLLALMQINESVGQIAAQSDDLAATVKGNIRDAAGVASQEVRGRDLPFRLTSAVPAAKLSILDVATLRLQALISLLHVWLQPTAAVLWKFFCHCVAHRLLCTAFAAQRPCSYCRPVLVASSWRIS